MEVIVKKTILLGIIFNKNAHAMNGALSVMHRVEVRGTDRDALKFLKFTDNQTSTKNLIALDIIRILKISAVVKAVDISDRSARGPD